MSRSQSSSRESLLKSNGGTVQKSFYFTPKSSKRSTVQDDLPNVTVIDQGSLNSSVADYTLIEDNASTYVRVKNWFNKKLFGYQPLPSEPQDMNKKKLRKVPVKVEPKVFFANERTFLSWLNMAVTLAGISIGILTFADKQQGSDGNGSTVIGSSKIYGLLLLPVAIAFCLYALFTYVKRAGMIRRKEPGPYEDKWGPLILTIMLITSIVLQFAFLLMRYLSRQS